MKIAYLILCHRDPKHVKRLCERLKYCKDIDVYVHLDKKVNRKLFLKNFKYKDQIYFIKNTNEVYWGGYSAITATIKLLEIAHEKGYDRYVLLQGADYPLVTDKELNDFFIKNKDVEFIRACNVSNSTDKYFYSKCRYYWFFDKINILKRIVNKLNRVLDLKIRKKDFDINGKKYNYYWGCAQWALTRECIDYILNFRKENIDFDKYFKHVFPVDEMYFHTIIFNSEFSKKTFVKGSEEELRKLVNWRNLHYFEYDKEIKVFTEEDYNFLKGREELFIRKVNSEKSNILLDILDYENKLIK